MREPAPLVFLEAECGPIPQSSALPTTGSSRKRWNPSGRCDCPIVAESYPLMADAHTPGLRLGGCERRVAAEAGSDGQPLGLGAELEPSGDAAALVADRDAAPALRVLAALDGDRHPATAAAGLRDALGPDEPPAHPQHVVAVARARQLQPRVLAAEPLQRARRRDHARDRAGALGDRQDDLELRDGDAERAVARA